MSHHRPAAPKTSRPVISTRTPRAVPPRLAAKGKRGVAATRAAASGLRPRIAGSRLAGDISQRCPATSRGGKRA
jgi:hypothetical protein